MTYVGLDLSINSTGVAIIKDNKLIVDRITPFDYDKTKNGTRYDKMHAYSMQIGTTLMQMLMPYRFDDLTICIEEVAFGFQHRNSSSMYNLLFEGATIAALMQHIFKCNVWFVGPTSHKKAFTGKGNAKKEDSVRVLLEHWPELSTCADKLDDIADAISVLSFFINVFDAKL